MGKLKVPVGISNRHVHLCQEHLEILFGTVAPLTMYKQLKQPGQFVVNECVSMRGPKGLLERVRLLFPLRDSTQVEISRSDAFKLGVPACFRHSGDLKDTPGIDLIGPAGEVTLEHGVIVALRHVHLDQSTANRLSAKDGSTVEVTTTGVRSVVFRNVLLRVSSSYISEFHVDLDEANAASLDNGDFVFLSTL